MNLPQKIVLIIAALGIATIALFPPWIFVYHYVPLGYSRGYLEQRIERPAGYHAIWAPHVPSDEQALVALFNISPDRSDLQYFSIRLDKDRTWIQLAAAFAVAAILTALLKSKKPN